MNHTSLSEIFETQLSMPEERVKEILAIGKEKPLLSNEFFISAGDIPVKFGFVLSGLFRYVYTDEKGKEYTKGIIAEHQFISSYSAMIAQKPSYFSVEALEASRVFEIPYFKWQELKGSHPFWCRFLLSLVEKGFIIKEKRERELLLLDAESRYRNFQRDYPGMENRIKQNIIASFLGIQPESLSRIRKKSIS
jgi:CRP-like cAMP-binding protein